MGIPGTPFTLIETYDPDQHSVESGLRILARLIARTYAREKELVSSNGQHDPSWIPPQEESSDEPEN